MSITRGLAFACVLLLLAACDRKPVPPATPPAPVGTPVPPATPSEGSDSKPSPPTDTGKEPQPNPMAGLKEFASLPDEFYGKWHRKGSSGGMDGQGEKEPPDETIVITKANKIETWTAGKLVSTVAFRVGRGKSIFGNDNWQINRSMFNEVIVVGGTGELSIMENHPDGFSWSYERVK